MKINSTELFCGVSDALDYVEKAMFGATFNHSKRVAFLSSEIGKKLKVKTCDLSDLAACALLHDNALTEYIFSEYQNGIDVLLQKDAIQLSGHCISGERNISELPMYSRVKSIILYHHEQADGSGPFKKKEDEVPLFSHIIHLADLVDVAFAPKLNGKISKSEIIDFVKKYRGVNFSSQIVDAFLECIKDGIVECVETEDTKTLIRNSFPPAYRNYTSEEIIQIATIFAKIVDYKSSFTCEHSRGIAKKAYTMGVFYNWNKDDLAEYYLAASLHDIGKLAVDTKILEKPDKLTDDEFTKIKFHAQATYDILSQVTGFEQITKWASYHHEKLDGSGYPFKKQASELDQKSRLLACIDIYQALIEDRPYKKGMSHQEVIDILRLQADNGKLDGKIVSDLDTCLKH